MKANRLEKIREKWSILKEKGLLETAINSCLKKGEIESDLSADDIIYIEEMFPEYLNKPLDKQANCS